MPRETLDRQIHQLQDEVLLLGSMVEQALLNAVDTLKRRDISAAQKIFANDIAINEKRYALENALIIIIATQQPMARDLRLLASVLETIIELERIGDYAKGIAKVVIRLGDSTLPMPMREFSQMAEQAASMLHRALSAFINEDAAKAREIVLEDDQVDELYNKAYRAIVTTMIANPEIIDDANLLVWVAHNLERAADRVTNICERTVYIATGELFELDTDDSEETAY
ncbi:phosphate uptake regulator, PhoU [Anaerolinea thermolimosa]|uniref:Phosphate-specific transport system accessory protein PhoU n=1 Tax=Anaerolinea thermolimosa TaxID=229919 RepID=A0A7U9PV79_9CHLR|nr:phosphate signaling complex protein PhoU [Anaerolinea thermolimosa]GAP08585.1 phosphate uptake regulator, PhoU [Anaerolinea thermolimosa]